MWHCQSQFRGSGGGGVKSGLNPALARSVGDVDFFGGGEAGSVMGSFGENGDGGIERLEDLKGFDVMLRCCGMMCSSCRFGSKRVRDEVLLRLLHAQSRKYF